MKRIWGRIDGWLAANAASVADELKPGISDVRVEQVEEKLEMRLPEELRSSYAVHDGGGLGLFGGAEFLSLEQVAQEWLVMDASDLGRFVPFIAYATGERICIDTETDAAPVVEVGDGEVAVLAPSLTDWFGTLATNLERGAYEVDDGWLVRVDDLAGVVDDEPLVVDRNSPIVKLLEALVAREAIELESPDSFALLEADVEKILARSRTPSECARRLCGMFLSHEQVAELYVDEREMAEILESL